MTLQEYLERARAERKLAAAKHAERLSNAQLEQVHGELVREWNRWRQEDVLDEINAVRAEYARRRGTGA